MGDTACFPTYIRAVCLQLSSLTSHFLFPVSLSLLSIIFSPPFPRPPLQINHVCMHVCHTNYMLSMVRREKSSRKAHVVLRCLHSHFPTFLHHSGGRHHFCFFLLAHRFGLPLIQRIPEQKNFSTNPF